jgi:predicted transcriptional regulator of viral defense system
MGDMMGEMEPRSKRERPDREGLFLLATEQAGHFTTAQAAEYAMSPALLSYHASTGTLQRVFPGVYRFRDYPGSLRDQVVAAWLAVGKVSAVVSHESALDLWDLTDLIPNAIHLTVPRSRRNLPKLPGVRIHTTTAPLRSGDVRTTLNSVRLTSPERTLLDIATAGQSPEHVIVGVRQACAKGWIDESGLRFEARDRGKRIAEMIDLALSWEDVGTASIR